MKQSYHTDFAIQYQLGLLHKNDCENIPKSTLYSWKKKDFSKLIGSEITFSDEKLEIIKAFLTNQKLLRAAKGLYYIFSVWISLTINIRGMKTILRKNKDIIIKTIDLVTPLMGLKHACKLFKISQTQYYTWKRKVACTFSPLKECLKTNTSNISPSELKIIEIFLQNEQYKDYPLAAIYYEMMRQKKAFMSLTTFYKYANQLEGNSTRRVFKPKQKIGIRAKQPKEILHADVCVYRPLDHTKCFIYFIVDNFSRMILSWKISTEYKSAIMLDNLRQVYSSCLLEKEDPLTTLLVDDGIENKGFVCQAIENNEIKINRLIAQKDIQFSNSMVEAVNKRMKYDFLFRQQLLDFNHTQRFLTVAVEQYNHRPHSALYGLTPYEVFHGRAPDKTLFNPQKEQAKILRKAENIALSCDNCALIPLNQE